MLTWQPHVEVWLLVGGLIALGWYAAHVVGPKAVPAGEVVVTRRQKGFFVAGIVTLWVAADWPLHDVSEEFLYSAHMVQHFLIAYVVPPLFLLATPTWLGRLILGHGRVERVVRVLARPIPAAVLFNGVIIFSHWPSVVNVSVSNGVVHYGMHVLLVTVALLAWIPVCGPFPEMRMSLPAQMIYLFTMSIVPTVPAAWLTLGDKIVYDAYDIPERLWGISAISDQQAAGLFMKLGGAMYLWGIITVLFFQWAWRHEQADRRGELVTERDVLTWDEVEKQFERLGPAKAEPGVPRK
jgi:putative membrane protein